MVRSTSSRRVASDFLFFAMEIETLEAYAEGFSIWNWLGLRKLQYAEVFMDQGRMGKLVMEPAAMHTAPSPSTCHATSLAYLASLIFVLLT